MFGDFAQEGRKKFLLFVWPKPKQQPFLIFANIFYSEQKTNVLLRKNKPNASREPNSPSYAKPPIVHGMNYW